MTSEMSAWFADLAARAPRTDRVLIRLVAHFPATAATAEPLLWMGDALAEAATEMVLIGLPARASELRAIQGVLIYEAGRRSGRRSEVAA